MGSGTLCKKLSVNTIVCILFISVVAAIENKGSGIIMNQTVHYKQPQSFCI